MRGAAERFSIDNFHELLVTGQRVGMKPEHWTTWGAEPELLRDGLRMLRKTARLYSPSGRVQRPVPVVPAPDMLQAFKVMQVWDAAARAAGYGWAELGLLTHDKHELRRIRMLIDGVRALPETTFEVDANADPFVPHGWKVVKHERQGKVVISVKKGGLYLNGKRVERIRNYAVADAREPYNPRDYPILKDWATTIPGPNACILDALIVEHPQLIEDLDLWVPTVTERCASFTETLFQGTHYALGDNPQPTARVLRWRDPFSGDQTPDWNSRQLGDQLAKHVHMAVWKP